MENIINNPGLQHLVEKVFWNLDVEDLKICAQINQSCKQILTNSMFWLGKLGGLSEKSQKDWIKIIQSVKNSDYERVIVSFLQWNLKREDDVVDLPNLWFKKFRSLSQKDQKDWIKVITSEKNSEKEKSIFSYLLLNLKKEALEDLPCYTSPDVQDDFRKKIYTAVNCAGVTPIYLAAFYGYTDIVKILAPLTDNPNAPNNFGVTPIHLAAFNGHTEIIKILAPLTDNPNASYKIWNTPIHLAALNGHTEIVKILATFDRQS